MLAGVFVLRCNLLFRYGTIWMLRDIMFGVIGSERASKITVKIQKVEPRSVLLGLVKHSISGHVQLWYMTNSAYQYTQH